MYANPVPLLLGLSRDSCATLMCIRQLLLAEFANILGCFWLQMLDEIQAGIFDGWTYEDIEQQMPQEYAARKADKLKYRCGFTLILPCLALTLQFSNCVPCEILPEAWPVPMLQAGRCLGIRSVVDTVQLAVWHCMAWWTCHQH